MMDGFAMTSYDRSVMKLSSIFEKVAKRYASAAQARREVIAKSNDALNRSKRAIFAFHRNDIANGKALLAQASEILLSCDKLIKDFLDDDQEGAFHAALEEYAEAQLFCGYLESGELGKVDALASQPSVYIGGLSDATGEIARHALLQATKGSMEDVERAYNTVEAVISFLYTMDLTGYLRTKFDQAKKNLRQLEQMRYELSLRK